MAGSFYHFVGLAAPYQQAGRGLLPWDTTAREERIAIGACAALHGGTTQICVGHEANAVELAAAGPNVWLCERNAITGRNTYGLAVLFHVPDRAKRAALQSAIRMGRVRGLSIGF